MLNGHIGEVGGHGGVHKVREPLAAIANDQVHRCSGRAIRPGFLAQLPQHRAGPAVQVDMAAQRQINLRAWTRRMSAW